MDNKVKVYKTFAVSLEDTGKAIPTLAGQCILYNQLSSDCGGWCDMFLPGCFAESQDDDILALYNHNSDHILGRVSNGRLKLQFSDAGVSMSLDMSNTSIAKDIVTLIEDETVKGMSFGCFIDESEWDLNSYNLPVQKISKATLVEVTITGNPSFVETSVLIKRSLEEAKKEAAAKKVEMDMERVRLAVHESLKSRYEETVRKLAVKKAKRRAR